MMRTSKAMPSPKPGYYTDIPDADYHSIDALGCSEMKVGINEGMAAFRMHCDAPPKPPSADMVLGTLVGIAIFRPDEYAKRTMMAPINPNTGEPYKPNSDAYRKAQAEADRIGKILVCGEHAEIVPRMVASARQHPLAAKLIAMPGDVEPTAIWDEPLPAAVGGVVRSKARADKIILTGESGWRRVEVKTTASLATAEWQRKIANLGYHIQDRWYNRAFRHALQVDLGPAYFIVIQNEPPYSCEVGSLHEDTADVADARIAEFLHDYGRCVEAGIWPGPDWNWRADDGKGGYEPRIWNLPAWKYAQHSEGD